MKSLSEILKEINRIELNEDVNKISFKGILLWPIIRAHLSVESLKGNIATNVDNIFLRIWVLIADSFTLLKFHNLIRKNIFFVYGYDPSGKYIINNNIIHKQANPIRDYVGKDDFYLLEFGTRNFNTPRLDHIVNVSLLFSFYKTIFFPVNFIKKRIRRVSLEQQIDKLSKKYKIDNKVWNNIDDFFEKKSFFDFLIRLIKPKQIFLKSFNNTTAFSLIYVANKNYIPTIDYQHGQQGDNNLNYTNWFSIPSLGYQLLPRYFWLWGSNFEKKFDPWLSKQKYHKTIIVGNLWFNFVKNNKELFPLVNLKKDVNVNVLVCLQKTHIPKLIEQAIICSKGVRWYFRLHPRELNNKVKLLKALNDLNVQSSLFEIEISNNSLIESLLQSVDVVITEWSTVAYEALLFKKKSIVIHENGLNAYSQLIKENKIYYINELKELLKELKV